MSTIQFVPERPPFAPTDLVLNTRHSSHGQDEALLIEIFLGGLAALRAGAQLRGRHLVLRDHAHSQYCTSRDPASRPTLREMMPPDLALLSVVTLRHPVDSYLSLRENGWHGNMQPATIDEYARRYIAFLDRHSGLPWLRYEDFLADPQARLADLCRWLELPYSADALDLFPIIRLSGDSGRTGHILASRPRRRVPEDLAACISKSADLRDLCDLTGYDPDL